jgi:YfiH family protein
MTEINYAEFLGVPAFTSTAEIDFMKGDPAATPYVLTAVQRKYLQVRGIALEKGIVLPKQVHGDVIWKVTAKDVAQAGIFEADAVVTDILGLAIAIRTADCLPALLYDPVRKVAAAVHAGWKSTKLDIARKTVELLRSDYGVDPKNIRAAIGPCIRKDSCAVGPEFREYFPLDIVQTPQGLYFDIVSANMRQLTRAGVRRENILDNGFCSFAGAARFHSFRRDADQSGRMISVMTMVK